MNWLTILILAYLAIGLQTGLSPLVRIGPAQSTGAEPNFGLLAVVFICLNAERRAALIGAFFVGVFHDLATQQPFGLFAFSYGLCALAITSLAPAVYKSHPLTHCSFALFGGCLTALVVWINCQFHKTSVPAVATLGGVIYTAFLAPLVIAAAQRAQRLFVKSRRH